MTTHRRKVPGDAADPSFTDTGLRPATGVQLLGQCCRRRRALLARGNAHRDDARHRRAHRRHRSAHDVHRHRLDLARLERIDGQRRRERLRGPPRRDRVTTTSDPWFTDTGLIPARTTPMRWWRATSRATPRSPRLRCMRRPTPCPTPTPEQPDGLHRSSERARPGDALVGGVGRRRRVAGYRLSRGPPRRQPARTDLLDTGLTPGTTYTYTLAGCRQRRKRQRPGDQVVTTALEAAPAGAGFAGSYFPNTTLSGPAIGRLDPALGFAWGTSPPVPGIASTNYSVRWTGRLTPAEVGHLHVLHTVRRRRAALPQRHRADQPVDGGQRFVQQERVAHRRDRLQPPARVLRGHRPIECVVDVVRPRDRQVRGAVVAGQQRVRRPERVVLRQRHAVRRACGAASGQAASASPGVRAAPTPGCPSTTSARDGPARSWHRSPGPTRSSPTPMTGSGSG